MEQIWRCLSISIDIKCLRCTTSQSLLALPVPRKYRPCMRRRRQERSCLSGEMVGCQRSETSLANMIISLAELLRHHYKINLFRLNYIPYRTLVSPIMYEGPCTSLAYLRHPWTSPRRACHTIDMLHVEAQPMPYGDMGHVRPPPLRSSTSRSSLSWCCSITEPGSAPAAQDTRLRSAMRMGYLHQGCEL